MVKTFKINIQDMFLDTKQPKKHQERFKRKLLGDDAYYKRWQENRERIAEEKKNIQRVDAQTKGVKW